MDKENYKGITAGLDEKLTADLKKLNEIAKAPKSPEDLSQRLAQAEENARKAQEELAAAKAKLAENTKRFGLADMQAAELRAANESLQTKLRNYKNAQELDEIYTFFASKFMCQPRMMKQVLEFARGYQNEDILDPSKTQDLSNAISAFTGYVCDVMRNFKAWDQKEALLEGIAETAALNIKKTVDAIKGNLLPEDKALLEQRIAASEGAEKNIHDAEKAQSKGEKIDKSKLASPEPLGKILAETIPLVNKDYRNAELALVELLAEKDKGRIEEYAALQGTEKKKEWLAGILKAKFEQYRKAASEDAAAKIAEANSQLEKAEAMQASAAKTVADEHSKLAKAESDSAAAKKQQEDYVSTGKDQFMQIWQAIPREVDADGAGSLGQAWIEIKGEKGSTKEVSFKDILAAVQKAADQRAKYKQKAAAAEEDARKAKEELGLKSTELSGKINYIKELEESKENLGKLLEEKTGSLKELRDANSKQAEELKGLYDKLKMLEAEKESGRAPNAEFEKILEEIVAEAGKEKEAASKEAARLSAEIARLKSEIESAANAKTAAESKLAGITAYDANEHMPRKDHEITVTELIEAKGKVLELEADLTKKAELEAKAKAIEEDLAKRNRECGDLQQKFADSEKAKEAAESEIAKLKSEAEKASAVVVYNPEKHVAVEKYTDEIGKRDGQLAAKQKAVEDLTAENAELKKELEAKQKSVPADGPFALEQHKGALEQAKTASNESISACKKGLAEIAEKLNNEVVAAYQKADEIIRKADEDARAKINAAEQLAKEAEKKLEEKSIEFENLGKLVERIILTAIGQGEHDNYAKQSFTSQDERISWLKDSLKRVYVSKSEFDAQAALVKKIQEDLDAEKAKLEQAIKEHKQALDAAQETYNQNLKIVNAEKIDAEKTYNKNLEKITAEKNAADEAHKRDLEKVNAEKAAAQDDYNKNLGKVVGEKATAQEAYDKNLEKINSEKEFAEKQRDIAHEILSSVLKSPDALKEYLAIKDQDKQKAWLKETLSKLYHSNEDYALLEKDLEWAKEQIRSLNNQFILAQDKSQLPKGPSGKAALEAISIELAKLKEEQQILQQNNEKAKQLYESLQKYSGFISEICSAVGPVLEDGGQSPKGGA